MKIKYSTSDEEGGDFDEEPKPQQSSSQNDKVLLSMKSV